MATSHHPMTRAEVQHAFDGIGEESIAGEFVVVHGTVLDSNGLHGVGSVLTLDDYHARGLLLQGIVRPAKSERAPVEEPVVEASAEDEDAEDEDAEDDEEPPVLSP